MRIVEHNRTMIESLLQSGWARLSLSQLGEDCILSHYLGETMNGFYVDVGCHDPVRYSNTAVFSALNGWTGINIDPDPETIERYRSARPRDIHIACAVGLTDGTAEFLSFDEGAVGTLDPEMAVAQRAQFGEPRTSIVDVRRLATLLSEHLPEGRTIDLLDVDVEGWDLDVLRSNDWNRFRARFVAVEAHDFRLDDPHASPLFSFMIEKGYELVSHAVVTSIYRSRA